jgi:plasmid maintenance system antidote protein VapI
MYILIKAKEQTGLKYTDIAEKTGLHKSAISKVLRGTGYASLAMHIRVGQAMGVSREAVQAAWREEQIAKIEAEIKASNTTIQELSET